MCPERKTEKKRRGKLFTRGEQNRVIDSIIHPFRKTDKGFVLVDGILHGLVERDPPQSALKFVKFNLPIIMNQLKAFLDSNKSSNALSQMISDSPTTLGSKKSSKKGMFPSIYKNARTHKRRKHPKKVIRSA